MVIQKPSVESFQARARRLGIAEELARTIQERSRRYAAQTGLEPEAAEARFFTAALAALDAAGSDLEHSESVLREIDLRVNDLNPKINVSGSSRIGIFGWGIVAPGVGSIGEFEQKIRDGGNWLELFNGFGQDNFLVGQPKFDFGNYRAWIEERFEPNRFSQIDRKLGTNAKFAIGAFIQSLGQNPGIEQTLIDFGLRTHIYVGTGVGDIPVIYKVNVAYYKAQRRWNRFWADPSRCTPLRQYLALDPESRRRYREKHGVPNEPEEEGAAPTSAESPDFAADEAREEAREAWEAYWTGRSDVLAQYLRESAKLHDIEKEKVRIIKKRLNDIKKLNEKWKIPPEPWTCVSANRIWNIDNIPAAQIAMLGRIHGPSFAPIGACSGFDIALDLGIQAIRDNRAKAVIVGMTDPPPHPVLVGAFYDARVISCDGKMSHPLAGLKGTHVSGGSLIWILGDLDAMLARGHRPLGCELLATGVSSDAFHIITPSKTGPRLAIEDAIKGAGVATSDIDTWDLHATATPGDWMEVQNVVDVLGRGPILTAKKGVFGHGMSVGGGWELTAQHLAMAEGILHPSSITDEEIHPDIAKLIDNIVTDQPYPFKGKIGGKINMGIGGINGVVISKVWEFDPTVLQMATVLGCTAAELRARVQRGEIKGYVDKHGIDRVTHAEYCRLTSDPKG